LGTDAVNLGKHLFVFRALLPHIVPVLALIVAALRHDLEHVLGRVLVVAAVAGAVPLEIIQQRLRVAADIAKVDGAPALGEEQQPIKLLEQNGVGLVDGAEHGLSGVGKAAEQHADAPGALGVEAAGGFVQEEQQLGLGHELDADGQHLALLDVQAVAGNADDGVGVLLHAEDLDHLLDEGVFFLDRDGLGTAEHGAEAQTFADGGRVEVEI
jgi:hypothetical protein